MEQALAPSDLTALHEKVDLLTAQVQMLTDQARAASRRQAEREELMQDVIPIADQAVQIVIEQLEDVQEYVNLCDLVRLAKRLLRSGQNFDKALDRLESLMDLAQTVGPLTDSAFQKATDALESAEQKGYFAFARGGAQVVDNVVASFSEEDVKLLGENIVLILNVVKDLTQPQILGAIQNIIAASENELRQPIDTSLRSLLGQMRDPDVRRGLVLTMRVLRVIGAEAAGTDRTVDPSINK
jgi:uncharacterized protein YjgD (DUF1641 family)